MIGKLKSNIAFSTILILGLFYNLELNGQSFPFVILNNSGGNLGIYQSSTGSSPFEYLSNGGKLVAEIIKNGRYMVNTPDAVGGASNFYFIDVNSVKPDCNTDIIEITTTTANIRVSASTSASNVLTNSGSKPGYGNLGDRYAFKSSVYNGTTLWYEIYLTNRWNQSTGWVSINVSKKYTSEKAALGKSTLNNAANITQKSCDLSWSTVAGASIVYDILGSVPNQTNLNATSFTFNNTLTANTSYSSYIIAKNDLGCLSDNSNTINFNTLANSSGSVNVTTSPSGANSDGAQWNIDGGSWRNSGVTETGVSAGSHTINFKSISCWTTPSSQNVNVTNGNTSNITGNYISIAPTTPIIVAQGGITSFCEGAGSATLQVTNVCSGCSYTWSPQGSGTSLNVTSTGDYSCISSSSGCSGQSSSSNSISISAKSIPKATFVQNGSGCMYNFTDNSNNDPISWNWDFGDPGSFGNTSTSQNPQHNFTCDKTYNIALQATNTCGNNSINQPLTISGCQPCNGVNIKNFTKVQHFEIFPNPVFESANIIFSIFKNSRVSIRIFDVQGKEIAVITEADYLTGTYSLDFNKIVTLSRGTYFVNFVSDEFCETKKIIIQ